MGRAQVVGERLHPANKTVDFVTMWQSVLECKDAEDMENVLALVQMMLVLPMHTAEIERNFSLASRIKSDWRNRLQPSTVSDLMMLKLSNLTVETFDPLQAICIWAKSGRVSRRPYIAPHGHHTRPK